MTSVALAPSPLSQSFCGDVDTEAVDTDSTAAKENKVKGYLILISRVILISVHKN